MSLGSEAAACDPRHRIGPELSPLEEQRARSCGLPRPPVDPYQPAPEIHVRGRAHCVHGEEEGSRLVRAPGSERAYARRDGRVVLGRVGAGPKKLANAPGAAQRRTPICLGPIIGAAIVPTAPRSSQRAAGCGEQFGELAVRSASWLSWSGW
jgi:hypothetical protein